MRMLLVVIAILIGYNSNSQIRNLTINRLKDTLKTAITDRDRVLTMAALTNEYSFSNADSAYQFGTKALALAREVGFSSGEIKALCMLGIACIRNGDMPGAIEYGLQALQLSQNAASPLDEGLAYFSLSKSYFFMKDYETSIGYGIAARQLFNVVAEADTSANAYFSVKGDDDFSAYFENEIMMAEAHLFSKRFDSAIYYFEKIKSESADAASRLVTINMYLGHALFLAGRRDEGLNYQRLAFESGLNDNYRVAWAASLLAECYSNINKNDSAIFFAKTALAAAEQVGFKDRMLHASQLLSSLYESVDIYASHQYLKMASVLNDDMFGQDKVFELQATLAKEQQLKVAVEKQQMEYRNNIRVYSLFAGLAVIAAIAIILYRNNQVKNKTNAKLQQTLADLKATQAQLIQSEKMASLGELTAGIAHEIQNPLNFVNNFSEINDELIGELVDELNNGNAQEAKAIAKDVKINAIKISEHGKRAGAIVKGMLEHSRKSNGLKESTDINKLAEECLRLAYHAMQAIDGNFDCEYNAEFDENLPRVNVVSQEISRVLLNIINNAFYAVNEKMKQVGNDYRPRVTVATQLQNKNAIITVRDNGIGIPDALKNKIFQPFFTTKPTGSGTGLGLSLSYDIVKAHGGAIRIESNSGEGTTFRISLPAAIEV